jgi:hypothetical protein
MGVKITNITIASGDIRNAVRTIVKLPNQYTNQMNIDINDRDIDIVARNAIMLLMLFVHPGDKNIVECVLHAWYSTFLTRQCLEKLSKVRELIQEVCTKLKEKSFSQLYAKTWYFGNKGASLRLILTKSDWMDLLRYFEVPKGLSENQAGKIRSTTMSASHRINYLHRSLYNKLNPNWRLCEQRSREDVLMLPFGMPRENFIHPTP